MPVSVIPSAKQPVDKQKTTARKRRRNQNVEIDELASLVPLATPLVSNENSERSLVPSSGGKAPAIDKISVLRLTSTFLKLQNFMKETSPMIPGRGEKLSTFNLLGLMEEAMDGFLIVLDKEANVLYVSETITGYVGLSQQDVIGQNLIDISHAESAVEIRDNLKPSATPPVSMVEESIVSQFRQFYVRFRSTVSPTRMQLSRFTSHTMVQVNGNLKVRLPPSKNFGKRDVEAVEPSAIGFIGECRLIESASSILELSVPHSTFTMTKSLDMKIISVESTVKEIVGYDPEDLIGDGCAIVDFFHPADYKRMVPCEKFLMRTGHAVSPHFRFLTSSGDWVWMQLEATLRYKTGTSIPQFWEVKARVLRVLQGDQTERRQGSGKLKFIEQNELYASSSDPDQDLLNPHRDLDIIPKLANTSKHCKEEGAKPIIDSFKTANLPDSVLEPVLHARSMAMNDFPKAIKPILTPNTADDFVAQRDQAMMKRNDSLSSIASSPLSTLSPPSASSISSGQSPTAKTKEGSATSRISSLSSSVASPLSSVSSPPVSPPTIQSSAPSPNTTASVSQSDTAVSSKSVPAGIGQFTQVQRHEGASPNLMDTQHIKTVQDHNRMMVAPTVVQDQNGVQSPPSVASSDISSPASSTMMMPTPQNCGNGHLSSHVANGVPSPSSSTVSAVSSPPSVFSPEMGAGLHTALSTDSIPSVPFQNLQTSNFIPQAQAPISNGFNHQIPSDFNFNHSTSPYLTSAAQNPAFIPNLATTTTFGTSNSDLNPNDPIVQQLLGDLVTLNGDPNFGNLSSLPNVSTANSFYDSSHSEHPHSNFRTALPNSSPPQPPLGQVNNNTFAMSYDVAMTQMPGSALPPHVLLDSQKTYASNSNAEVQDILQQFQ